MPAADKKALFLKLVEAGVNINAKVRRPGLPTFVVLSRSAMDFFWVHTVARKAGVTGRCIRLLLGSGCNDKLGG